MKSIFTKTIFCTLFIIGALSAQVEELNCVEGSDGAIYQGQLGGYILPSSGTLNVLIVFCQFPDDNYNIDDLYWKKGQPPANMNEWVDQTWTSNPIEGSLTHYFNAMSFNTFKFTGKTVYVTTPHTRAWYLDQTPIVQRLYIQEEIIEDLDLTWDFGQFDNWELNQPYTHINESDGIVEMIIFVWRNIANEFSEPVRSQIYTNLNFSNYGHLGPSPFSTYEIYVDNNQRKIRTGFYARTDGSAGGSGVTIIDQVKEKNIWATTHEFAHYLMGNNSYHVGYGFWGMLDAWGKKSKVANSFERYRLGWININEINSSPNQTIYNATLPDYVTTGVAYRLNIDPASNQYFYIENHQNLDYWENNLVFGNVENGLYVLRQDGNLGSNVQIIPADGRFEWTVNQVTPNPWGSGDLPVFKNLGTDRVNGYHDLQYIPWVWNGQNQTPAPIHFTENENGQPVEDVRYQGDGKDAFRIGFNEVFSPWSNPNSYKANRTSTPFGFKINSLNSGVYSIDIYVGTALNAPPSKPGGVTIEWYGENPKITWETNEEPDISVYKIWKYAAGSSMIAATVTHNPANDTHSWIDNNVTRPGKFDPQIEYIYKVKAVDNTNKESLYSDEVSIIGTGDIWKKGIKNDESKIDKYELSNNFPNPFNPTTTISYSIKKNGLTSLKIFDILGNEVTTLVNKSQTAGNYSVEFNAEQLPSGIYIYRLTSGNFTAYKKLILMK